ncbi:MAG TPA: class I SAM-dependent methyltransferase [Candidatus Dojkabacteria bacterium]|jgi:SAM-dependent methyltransferase
MHDYQKITKESYEKNADKFISKTGFGIKETTKEWYSEFLKKVPGNGKILEIGTGHGRDADYFESLGYRVIRSDAVDSFINFNRSREKEIHKLDIINDPIEFEFDAVFANAVFLHFKREDFKKAIENLRKSGAVGKPFAFSLKEGEGDYIETEKLCSERFFKLWTEEELREFFKQERIEIDWIRTKAIIANSKNKWMQLVCRIN